MLVCKTIKKYVANWKGRFDGRAWEENNTYYFYYIYCYLYNVQLQVFHGCSGQDQINNKSIL